MRAPAIALLFSALLIPALAFAAPSSAGSAPAHAKKHAKRTAHASSALALPVALRSSVSSTVKVLGDSTLHKWDAKAGALSITAELAGGKTGSLLEQVKAGALSKLELVIGVDSLASNEGKSMDKNMHKAMDSDKFGSITFSLTGYTVTGDEVVAKGALTIHGTTKDVELKGKLAAKGEGIQVTGSFDSLMSDWGVKPPVMMMGTVRVADKIAIAYDYDLAK